MKATHKRLGNYKVVPETGIPSVDLDGEPSRVGDHDHHVRAWNWWLDHETSTYNKDGHIGMGDWMAAYHELCWMVCNPAGLKPKVIQELNVKAASAYMEATKLRGAKVLKTVEIARGGPSVVRWRDVVAGVPKWQVVGLLVKMLWFATLARLRRWWAGWTSR